MQPNGDDVEADGPFVVHLAHVGRRRPGHVLLLAGADGGAGVTVAGAAASFDLHENEGVFLAGDDVQFRALVHVTGRFNDVTGLAEVVLRDQFAQGTRFLLLGHVLKVRA